jgi:hypothetical protein
MVLDTLRPGRTLVLALENPAQLTLEYPTRGILWWVDWLITGVLPGDMSLSWCRPHEARSRGVGPLGSPAGSP